MNCSGGPTPWNSWLSCEEMMLESAAKKENDHGYVFEVPALSEGLTSPVPLKGMGRFQHEAAAIDPETGFVYLTEDRDGHPCLFYRFIPKESEKLHLGGKLQALVVMDQPACDLRNWKATGAVKVPEKMYLNVGWVDLDQVQNPKEDLADRSVSEKGAAIFSRLEGCWMGKKEVYFSSTNGGQAQCGQIWRYKPLPTLKEQTQSGKASGTIELVIESKNKKMINFCDNITIAPWGDIIVAEDGEEGHEYNLIKGITPSGKVYPIACNIEEYKGKYSEFTGVCFSPDGKTLYFSVQTPGRTYAVTGPWPQKNTFL